VRALEVLERSEEILAVPRAKIRTWLRPRPFRVVERLVGRAEQGLGFGGVIGKIATPSDAVTPMSWTPSPVSPSKIASP